MKKEDARRAVLREWPTWAAANPDDAKVAGGMLFFTYLQNYRPDLLEFRASGEKWQVVHGWLLTAGYVNN
jgi:hypothetical protein